MNFKKITIVYLILLRSKFLKFLSTENQISSFEKFIFLPGLPHHWPLTPLLRP
jgi:hypothetical protein